MALLKLNIPNMKCMGCSTTVENHLKKIGGVRNIEIDKEIKNVVIEFSGDKSIKRLILRTLEGVGYPGKEIFDS
jgi:copper chaperone CopZ